MKLTFINGVAVILLQLLSNTFAVTFRQTRAIPYYEDFLTYFITESPFHNPNYDKNFTGNVSWADVNLLKASVDFYRRNYVSFSLMLLDGMMQSISIKTMSSVVETTRSFENIPKAYERMLTTFIYFKLLFESGPEILDPKSNAGKTLELIRRRHRSAAYLAENRSLEALEVLHNNYLRELPNQKDIVSDWETQKLVWALRADLAHIDTSEASKDIGKWDWSKPVGQFDLGIVQFLFYGMIVLNPQGYGIYTATDEEIKAYAHFWAVVGRQIGIEDRFNVALFLPYRDHGRFYRNTIIASFKNAEVKNIRQMGNLLEGVYRNFPVPTFTRLKCWLFYFLKSPMPEFEGRHLFSLMNAEDILCLQLFGLVSCPLSLTFTFKALSAHGFDLWLRDETQRLDIKYEF